MIVGTAQQNFAIQPVLFIVPLCQTRRNCKNCIYLWKVLPANIIINATKYGMPDKTLFKLARIVFSRIQDYWAGSLSIATRITDGKG